MQLAPHVVSGHVAEQALTPAALATQNKPAPQATPHAPQLAVSVARLTHLPPQFMSPCAHWQAPAEHCWPAPHAFPHAPQFAGSTLVETQLLPQLSCPAGQDAPGDGELELQAQGSVMTKRQPSRATTNRFMAKP